MPATIETIARVPTPAEQAELIALLRACIEQGASLGFLLGAEEAALRAFWETCARSWSSGGRRAWVARDETGRIIGSIQLVPETKANGRHRAELQKLLVLPECRHRGLGSRLMAEAEAEARRLGLRMLFLDTSEGRAGAMRLYHKLGWEYVGGLPDFALDPDGTPARNAIYCKLLRPQGSITAGKAATADTQMEGRLTVRPMREADWPAIRSIYEEGMGTGHATFQSSAPDSWADFHSGKLEAGCLVAEDEETCVLGWASLSSVSSRCVYAGVADLSLYVAERARGRGVGGRLLDDVIRRSEEAGVWTLQSGTFPENTASLRLQQSRGFRIIGRRERLGLMRHGPLAGQWRDVFMLERRSRVAGCV